MKQLMATQVMKSQVNLRCPLHNKVLVQQLQLASGIAEVGQCSMAHVVVHSEQATELSNAWLCVVYVVAADWVVAMTSTCSASFACQMLLITLLPFNATHTLARFQASTQYQADRMEAQFQQLHNTMHPHGYNAVLGSPAVNRGTQAWVHARGRARKRTD
jgi:hypothetical protein